MRLKYTTYNARRDEDIIHLDTDQSNIMMLNPSYTYGSPGNPFKYCKVMAILHAEVSYIAELGLLAGATNHYHKLRLEFLWVRWYEEFVEGPDQKSEVIGAEDVGLERVSLRAVKSPDALEFIDPDMVLRACHLIPHFGGGRQHLDGKGTSQLAQDGSDWKSYYVNRCVDFYLISLHPRCQCTESILPYLTFQIR